VQTFLPLPDFAESAAVLDRQRLGKQRVEVLQLLGALTGQRPGWVNHPAAKMWRGHEVALARYGLAVVVEWTSRGYRDTCGAKIEALVVGIPDLGAPWWLGNEAFHLSHRSNLVRKLPEHYAPLWPGVTGDLPYVWPVG
jgi:hypothetical protein